MTKNRIKQNHLETPNKQPENKGDKIKAIAKYSGLASEIVGAILIPIIIGQQIDKRTSISETPIFTIILGFLGIAYVMYKIFKISSE